MQINDYLASLRAETGSQYRTSYNLLKEWNQAGSFADFLRKRNISENTVAKHIRQARCIIKECDLGIDIPPMAPVPKDFPTFDDVDFQSSEPLSSVHFFLMQQLLEY